MLKKAPPQSSSISLFSSLLSCSNSLCFVVLLDRVLHLCFFWILTDDSGAPGFLPVRNVEWIVSLLGTLMLFAFKMLVITLTKPDRMLLLKHSISREMNADHTALVGAACFAMEEANAWPTVYTDGDASVIVLP
jgi:hypothetical protein